MVDDIVFQRANQQRSKATLAIVCPGQEVVFQDPIGDESLHKIFCIVSIHAHATHHMSYEDRTILGEQFPCGQSSPDGILSLGCLNQGPVSRRHVRHEVLSSDLQSASLAKPIPGGRTGEIPSPARR
jgi:hypothetical protein